MPNQQEHSDIRYVTTGTKYLGQTAFSTEQKPYDDALAIIRSGEKLAVYRLEQEVDGSFWFSSVDGFAVQADRQQIVAVQVPPVTLRPQMVVEVEA